MGVEIKFTVPRDQVERLVEAFNKIGIETSIQPDGIIVAAWHKSMEELLAALERENNQRSEE